MKLTEREQAVLNGAEGAGAALAMEIPPVSSISLLKESLHSSGKTMPIASYCSTSSWKSASVNVSPR